MSVLQKLLIRGATACENLARSLQEPKTPPQEDLEHATMFNSLSRRSWLHYGCRAAGGLLATAFLPQSTSTNDFRFRSRSKSLIEVASHVFLGRYTTQQAAEDRLAELEEIFSGDEGSDFLRYLPAVLVELTQEGKQNLPGKGNYAIVLKVAETQRFDPKKERGTAERYKKSIAQFVKQVREDVCSPDEKICGSEIRTVSSGYFDYRYRISLSEPSPDLEVVRRDYRALVETLRRAPNSSKSQIRHRSLVIERVTHMIPGSKREEDERQVSYVVSLSGAFDRATANLRMEEAKGLLPGKWKGEIAADVADTQDIVVRSGEREALPHEAAPTSQPPKASPLNSIEVGARIQLSVESAIADWRKKQVILPEENFDYLVIDPEGKDPTGTRGTALCRVNADKPRSAASLVKPFVLLAYFQHLAANGLPYTKAARRHAEKMIQKSNNASTNWFFDQIGGADAVDRILREKYGTIFKDGKIVEHIPKGGCAYKNILSADDMGRLLLSLAHRNLETKHRVHWEERNKDKSEKVSRFEDELLRVMRMGKRTRILHRSPLYGKWLVRIASKTGSTRICYGDMGYCQFPHESGEGTRGLIIVGRFSRTFSLLKSQEVDPLSLPAPVSYKKRMGVLSPLIGNLTKVVFNQIKSPCGLLDLENEKKVKEWENQ